MSADCQADCINRKVSAFADFLKSDTSQENQHNLTNENRELLTKFAEFMKGEKLEKHKHEFMHGHKHGKFGKHGHHGMFGHHFGKHGPFGRHGHKHGHKHGKHEFGHHEHNFDKFGPEYFRKHGLHHKMGKHYWKHLLTSQSSNENVTGVTVVESADCNPSPPPPDNSGNAAAGSSQATTNINKTWGCTGHHRRHHSWHVCPYRQGIPTISRSIDNACQTENVTPQDNLITMVENIAIVTSPQAKE